MADERLVVGAMDADTDTERTLETRPERDAAPPGAEAAVALAPSSRIGRFVVVERLGEGGMGVVLAAYDPVLDRKVAVKVLRADVESGEVADRGRERLLREARAMARLEHPNVLAVHEVGTLGERVFLAMEFASGGTLQQWVRAQPRAWPEILDKYRAAARGLAAAHEQGLVHRDFKPENVLLTRDGQVRVADFGLVGRSLDTVADPLADTVSSLASAAAPATITQTGALLGSPAYMAPEQHRGEKAGPAADQFAFCVSLWEALYGERPFAGASREEICSSVMLGSLKEPPTPSPVPRWVTAALRRGLQRDPALRWPSMTALAQALEKDPDDARRARRRRLVAVSGAAALVLASAGGAVALYRANRPEPCPDPRPDLDAVWNPAEREQLRAAFTRTGAVMAAFALQRAGQALDEYANRWVEASSLACRESQVPGTRLPDVYERQRRCLARRLSALRQTLASLKAADAGAVGRAQQAVLALPDVAACSRAVSDADEPPGDAAARARYIELQDRLDRSRSDYLLGMYQRVFDTLPAVAERAAALGYEAAQAEALYYLGVARGNAGRTEEAIATLKDSVRAADSSGADGVRARALIALAFRHAIADVAGGRSPYLAWAEAAILRMSRAGHFVDDLLVMLHNCRANTSFVAGDYRATVEAGRLALRHLAAAPDAWAEAQTRERLAQGLLFLGRPEEALAEAHAGERLQRENAPGHPRMAVFSYLAATALNALGRSHEAEQAARNALALLEQTPGMKESFAHVAFRELAEAVAGRDPAEAVRLAHRAVELVRKQGETDVPYVVAVLVGILLESGRAREAAAECSRAFESARRAGWADHTDTAEVHALMGLAQESLGSYSEAERQFRRALGIFEPKFGPEHPSLIRVLSGLGRVRLAAGAPDEARSLLERAIAIRARPVDVPHVARARLALADLARARGDADAALRLASRARDELAAWGRDRAALERAEAMLARSARR